MRDVTLVGAVECVYVIPAFLFRHSRVGGNLGGGMMGAEGLMEGVDSRAGVWYKGLSVVW